MIYHSLISKIYKGMELWMVILCIIALRKAFRESVKRGALLLLLMLLYPFATCLITFLAEAPPPLALYPYAFVFVFFVFLLEKERATRTMIDKLAMERNIVLNPTWTSSSPSNVKELAARGDGVAILFEIQVRKELASGKLVKIPTDLEVKKNFYIIYRKDVWLSDEEQYLLQLCREYAP